MTYVKLLLHNPVSAYTKPWMLLSHTPNIWLNLLASLSWASTGSEELSTPISIGRLTPLPVYVPQRLLLNWDRPPLATLLAILHPSPQLTLNPLQLLKTPSLLSIANMLKPLTRKSAIPCPCPVSFDLKINLTSTKLFFGPVYNLSKKKNSYFVEWTNDHFCCGHICPSLLSATASVFFVSRKTSNPRDVNSKTNVYIFIYLEHNIH